MSFPQTSKTLILRVVTEGRPQDWHQFLSDYWPAVCGFARRRAGLSEADAEDVAAETFEALLRNRLLERWSVDRSAKLRTLLCTVVRHILGNRARVRQGRQALLAKHAHELPGRDDIPSIRSPEESEELQDAFYAAWVEDFLAQALEGLMREYHQTGRGDYFRVLHGRICERLTAPQIAAMLELKTTDVENYGKAARKRLIAMMQEQLRGHIGCYCRPEEADEEFQAEWDRMGVYLKSHGGLEEAMEKTAATAPSSPDRARSITIALNRLTGTGGKPARSCE